MLTMQPISLRTEGVNADGVYIYRVQFEDNGKEVDYTFFVDQYGVTADDQFIKKTFCDPFVPELYRSILKFHKARGLEQIQEQAEQIPEQKRDTV